MINVLGQVNLHVGKHGIAAVANSISNDVPHTTLVQESWVLSPTFGQFLATATLRLMLLPSKPACS